MTVDGIQAMQAFMQQVPDLVLTDIEMPVLDGYGVLAQVRRECIERGLPHVPVFAVTAHAQLKDAERFLAAGFDGYLTKPFNMAELKQVLAPIVAARELSDLARRHAPAFQVAAESLEHTLICDELI